MRFFLTPRLYHQTLTLILASLLTSAGIAQPSAQTTPPAKATPPPQPSLRIPPPSKPSTITLNDLKAQFPQTPQGFFILELPQILNTTTDPQVQSLLNGQTILTTAKIAQINPAPPALTAPPPSSSSAAQHSLIVTRDQILCCTSHLRHCSIEVSSSTSLSHLHPNDWVQITATLTYHPSSNPTQIKPILLAKTITAIPTPANPILP